MAADVNPGIIEMSRHDRHGALTINNTARRNAMSLAMWQQLAAFVRELDADPAIHLITLRGKDGTFVSGADISEFARQRADVTSARSYEKANGAAYAALREAATPTLALVEGFCFGGGLGLAAACDLRLAASSARFAVPAAKLGLAYPVDGVADLVALIGPAATKRLFFTADPIMADTALRIGLVEDVIAEEAFDVAAEKLIATILSRAPLTLKAAKSAVAAARDPERLDRARADAQSCFASADYTEGRQAFLEKRPPRFEGR